MQPYEYSISLRVFHPYAEPADISQALQMEPRRTWKVGEPRVTLKGTPLEGVYRETYWYTDLMEERITDASLEPLESALARYSSQLRACQDFLLGVRREGGRAEFYVGLYGAGSYGFEFDPELLAALAEIGLSLSLEVFPVAQNK